MRAVVLLAVMAAATADHSNAQVVRGEVIEVGAGTPVAGALLLLRDAAGEVRAASISNELGRFELRSDKGSLVRLEVRHIGYADWGTANFALATDAVLQVQIKLGIEAIPLEPITVVADARPAGRLGAFEQRRTSPAGFGGYFLTADDIARRPAAKPSTLVLGTPGMGVARGSDESVALDRSVIMAGDCVARTFIDGIRVQQSDRHGVDDVLPVHLVAGVEVYPRAMAAPPQYLDALEPDCGVVLFWTKEPERAVGPTWGLRRVAVGFGLILGLVTVGITR